jgi:hypothetical protein
MFEDHVNAAELFDFPILETGQPTVFGARLGCEQSLIDA